MNHDSCEHATLSPRAHRRERRRRRSTACSRRSTSGATVVQSHLEADAAPTAATLDPVVEASAVPALAADGLITGSGFVAAPGLLSDAHWHLAWWLGGPAGIRRLATIDDPSNDQFRDYTTLEWWRVPARTGARHLTGPYVDYVCTDDYTVTITTPVVVGGQLLGVVGMDVLVDRLERELLPLLRAAECRSRSSTRRDASSPRRTRGASPARCCGSTGWTTPSRRCASRSRRGQCGVWPGAPS